MAVSDEIMVHVEAHVEGQEYAVLDEILFDAAHRASHGKGRERHANPGEPFERQIICQVPRWMGNTIPQANGPLFQVIKKAIEATRLPPDQAEREILDLPVYAAAAVRMVREQMAREATPCATP